MSSIKAIYLSLGVSFVLMLGALWSMREAEGYVSKSFGVVNLSAYSYYSNIATWLALPAAGFWIVAIWFLYRIDKSQRPRIESLVAGLPLLGILLMVVATWLIPARYV